MNRPVRQKQKRIKNKKLTNSAKGEECTLRIPGVCNFNPETTVAAHINGAGMATKSDDPLISYGCSDCHQWLDGDYIKMDLEYFTEKQIKQAIRDSEQLRAIKETFPKLIQKGLIKV